MRLQLQDFEGCFELKQDMINLLYIEPEDVFARCTDALWNQYSGSGGEIFLYDSEGKEINIQKATEVIVNPFELKCNNKKIVSRIYQEALQIAGENSPEDMLELNRIIVELIDSVSQKMPYHLSYNLDLSLEEIFKVYDLKIDSEGSSLLERLTDYLRVSHRALRVSIYFLVNLKTFLTDNELLLLYEFALYENITLILLENRVRKLLPDENAWITDRDMCIIKLDELTAPRKCYDSETTSFEV